MMIVKAKPKQIQNVILKTTDTLISKKSLRNMMTYEKSKERRHSDSFISGKIAVKEYIEKKKLILISSESEFIKSTPDNFCWILSDPMLIKKGVESAIEILGMDSCHSITNQRIHVTSLGTVNFEFQFIPMFVAIHSGGTATTYETILQDVIQELEKLSGRSVNPILMIDNDSSEKAAIQALGLDFIICLFHIQRSHSQSLKSMVSSVEHRISIHNQLQRI